MMTRSEVIRPESTPVSMRHRAEIEAAVRNLNGRERDLLLIELPSGKCLTVGGGPELFICEVAENDTERWCLQSEASPDELIQLSVGGSHVEYPADWCVNLQAILTAVRSFINAGTRNPQLHWAQRT